MVLNADGKGTLTPTTSCAKKGNPFIVEQMQNQYVGANRHVET